MPLDTQWLKSHWYYIAAGVVGFFVLYEIISRLGGSSGASSSDLGGGAAQVNQLQAGVDVANADSNAKIAVAQIAGQVASNQALEQLQATEATVAGEVAVGLAQTQAARDVAITQSNNLVRTQQIVTTGQVQETGIVGRTLVLLGAQKVSVATHITDTVAAQITQIQGHSKHASQDYAAIAPLIALETYQGGAGVGIAQANTAKATGVAAVEGGVASTVVGGLTKILTGLFA
jgi:hypothetical protein